MEIATCFFLEAFACHGRKGAQNSPSGCPCHGQENSKVQPGQCPAALEVHHSKERDGNSGEEGKMQTIWVNDKLHFNVVNGEEFLALPGSQN